MKRKLISIVLTAAVMMVPLSLSAGKNTTYNTLYTITCPAAPFGSFTGSVQGTLSLTTRKGILAIIPTSCTPGGTSSTTLIAQTTAAPTSFSWTIANCLSAQGIQISPISGKIPTTNGQYACYAGPQIQVSGQLTVKAQ